MSKKGDYLDILLRSEKTVFSTREIFLFWGEKDSAAARNRLNYYVKKGDLIRLRRGLYAKDGNYNKFELATKIYTPSYISFETVLASAGAVFQFYRKIFVASYVTREISVGEQAISYRKIKDEIISDSTGIELKENYHIASPERAFLDVVYLKKGYHFDNLSSLDWEKVFKILPIYKNGVMEKRVNKYKKNA